MNCTFLILLIIYCTSFGKSEIFLHGETFGLRSELDYNYLTSSQYDFQNFENEIGINLGKLYLWSMRRAQNQLWNPLLIEKENVYWLFPRALSLNELTFLPNESENGTEFVTSPNKNLIELINILDIKTGNENKFLIKSKSLAKCLTNPGEKHSPAFYDNCDDKNKAQIWTFENINEFNLSNNNNRKKYNLASIPLCIAK